MKHCCQSQANRNFSSVKFLISRLASLIQFYYCVVDSRYSGSGQMDNSAILSANTCCLPSSVFNTTTSNINIIKYTILCALPIDLSKRFKPTILSSSHHSSIFSLAILSCLSLFLYPLNFTLVRFNLCLVCGGWD